MNCEQAKQLWHDRIDGCSDLGAVAEMQQHLAGCVECRRYCRQMDDLADALACLRDQSERAVMPRQMPRRLVMLNYRRLAGLAAAAIILVVAGLFLRTPQRAPNQFAARNNDAGPTTQIMQTTDISSQNAAPEFRTSVNLIGESAETQLAVKRETGNPRVHLYIVYPLVERTPAEKNLSNSVN
jgi:hypothetical protein